MVNLIRLMSMFGCQSDHLTEKIVPGMRHRLKTLQQCRIQYSLFHLQGSFKSKYHIKCMVKYFFQEDESFLNCLSLIESIA